MEMASADVGLDLGVDRHLQRDLPAHPGGQAGSAELALDALVGVHLGAVGGTGQPEHGVGLMTTAPDELRRPG